MFGQPNTATLADNLYSYTGRRPGMWRSLAAHLLWEQGVGGSNPPIPTSVRTLAPESVPFHLFHLLHLLHLLNS